MQIKNVGQRVRKNLGRVIKKKRAGLNIFQEDLAGRIGLTRTYLSLVENGKRFPSWETLEKIAHSLSMKPSKLIVEANLYEYDDDFELVSLLSRIIESADKEKIEQVVDFTKSLD
ncbi:hypothetical protein ES702_02012 [subsurface metagenome]